MKPLLIASIAIASFFTKANAATPTPKDVAPAILQSFQNAFAGVKQVAWSSTDANLYKAEFVLNEQYVTAFYNPNGELVALTRNIASYQLPVVLQATLKKDYSNYWISDLFELANEEGTTYYVTLETADTKLTLKSNLSTWTTYQKSKK
jgi:hypothetical protein